MENEELLKRLEWLDAERRKDKQSISDLIAQVNNLTDKLNAHKTIVKDLETNLKKTTQSIIRPEEVEEAVSKQKVEFSTQISSIDKKLASLEKKYDKQRKDDGDSISKRLIEFQTEIKPVGEFRKTIQDRMDVEFRTNQKIEDVAKQLPDVKQMIEEVKRSQKLAEDNFRIDSKRITDIQVELGVVRKKLEDERASGEVQSEFLKKIETQINELLNLEQVRKQEQLNFIETQSRATVDYENQWKEWEEKFSHLEGVGLNFQKQLMDIENTHRAVKQSVNEFDEINQKLDRRINEITEINRLSEERFRQEWVSFRADDQKRWTNYALTQDEQTRERDRDVNRLMEQISKIEESVQHLLDDVSVMNEETEKRIKGFLSLSNEILSSFERATGKRT